LGETFSSLTLLGGTLVVGSIVALLVFDPGIDRATAT
jgi:drug/metabolite transporter (DMT)-like permease